MAEQKEILGSFTTRDSESGIESFSLECRMKSIQHHTFLLFYITDHFFALLCFASFKGEYLLFWKTSLRSFCSRNHLWERNESKDKIPRRCLQRSTWKCFLQETCFWAFKGYASATAPRYACLQLYRVVNGGRIISTKTYLRETNRRKRLHNKFLFLLFQWFHQ